MTSTNQIINRVVARITLVVILIPMIYVASRPAYNFAHWLPHHSLYALGLPYSAMLWFERNADWLLHFFGAMLITALIIWSQIPGLSRPAIRAFILVSVACLGAEIFQILIDRGLETSDLLLGISGSFMAYSALTKKH